MFEVVDANYDQSVTKNMYNDYMWLYFLFV